MLSIRGLLERAALFLATILLVARDAAAHSCAYVDCYTYPGDACCSDRSTGWQLASIIIVLFFVLVGVGFCVWACVDNPSVAKRRAQAHD